MQSFDGELGRLYRNNVITKETALSFATNAGNLELAMQGIGDGGSTSGGSGGDGNSGGPEMAGMME